jgi:glycosyltransferase involved in cell wall biosynthesis
MVAHGCSLSWWTAVHGTPVPPELHRYRDVVRRGLTAADLVIAPTAALIDMMRPHYVRFPHARVIYHALPDPAPNSAGHADARERVVFSAGRLFDAGRNLSALRSLAESLVWPVRVAGPLDEQGAGRLEALGVLEPTEVTAHMRRAAVYVLPALYEPFGLSALEAAHAGCALVLGDIPTLREVWKNAAVFVAPGDTRSLHNAVDTLMRDEGLRTCLADRAYQRALCFRSSTMAASYMDAYAAVSHTRELLV